MTGRSSRTGPAGAVLCLLLVGVAGLALAAGCITPPPGSGQGGPGVTPTPSLPQYVVHVPGAVDRGFVLLVGRSTCPHCQATEQLLANMSIDYYWIDLNTLDEANTTDVLKAVSVCSSTQYVPMLIVRGRTCIIGDNETEIREALK
ncbi:MAG TPA: glutaredoxin domain-containing protein [Methanomicrobiales archaeon]|nr:glutaredoxin domain-containing protein [Methanomicrobiales archaeon]